MNGKGNGRHPNPSYQIGNVDLTSNTPEQLLNFPEECVVELRDTSIVVFHDADALWLCCRLYNVDDFFTSYVNELSRARQHGAPVVGGDGNGRGVKRGLDQPVLVDAPPSVEALPVDIQHQKQQGNGKSGRQQAANKVAQQRYRERKKQKYAEMEKTVAELKAQLSDLHALTRRNSMLEQMNSALQAQVVAKETELERLKASLDAQSDASLLNSSAGNGSEEMKRNGPCGEGACGPCDVLPRDLTGIDFQTGFADQISALRTFMKEKEITDDVEEKHLKKEDYDTLASLVGRCCQLCQAAIRAEGVRVLDLIKGSMEEWENKGGDPKWDEALDRIKVRQDQEREMLLLRDSHLVKMQEIYSEREQLNLDAIAMMLPHSSREPEKDMTVKGRLTSMSRGTYLPLARNNAELNEILEKIKQNLRREQRAMMELNCCTISQILTPLQAARYMTTVYPLHCDALALSNALSRRATVNVKNSQGPGSSHSNEGAVGNCSTACC